ncbi:hypothetical protein ASG90_01415 [Nocardioides sp. Soil797]|nr:hypothetical protein ASG90_01415 [Nocardioides sp. Soil797]
MTTAHQLPDPADLLRRHTQLQRRHAIELKLSAVAAGGGGIAGLVHTVAELTANPIWLMDTRRRVVARSAQVRGSDFRPPELDLLLERNGPADLSSPEPLLVQAEPARGIARRHLLVPVARDGCLFAWLVLAEVSGRLSGSDAHLAKRAAFHLASEYVVQGRVARASWNARSALARQLVRGSTSDDDVSDAAEYLGVQADAERVLAYIAEGPGAEPRDEEAICERVAAQLGVEVLGSRGREGLLLLIESPDESAHVTFVHEVKDVMRRLMVELGEPDGIVGLSGVSRPGSFQRAYRETREVVLCVDRFAASGERVIAVDDLGPARLFVANSDVGAVRRYVHEVLGALLTGAPGTVDLLRTLQCFFDTGRSVRESAARLGIHENTVRLRLAKVHDLTGLEVAADANHQLSAQTALLVLRLEGHPAIPSFDERHAPTAKKDRAVETA